MLPDPDRSRSVPPVDSTADFDITWEAGLAAAFALESTPFGWSPPAPLLNDSADHPALVRPGSPDMPKSNSSRYQLLGEIARGGMGVILKGRDPDLGRDLAVKVLKLELAGRPIAVERFVEEARVSGQLQHPGVVPVYELGELPDGRPYFTMKLIRGRTLAALLAERASRDVDRGRYLKIFEQVCQTMAYAHSKGVIHRDLKPSNVMVGNFGEVQVMDWGLAKVIPQGGIADELKETKVFRDPFRDEPAEDHTVIRTARTGSTSSDTQAGSVMGTPAYMAPEAAAGEIDKIDERVDVFGLGAILCVILTGQPPYSGKDAESVRQLAVRARLAEVYALLDACGAEMDLVAICKRCLAARQDERPRNAGEVTDAIHRHLLEVENRVQRAEVERAKSAAKAAEERKRRRVTLALAVCLLGLVVLVGGGAWWIEDQRATAAARQSAQQRETRREIKSALDEANRALESGRWTDAGTLIALVERRLGTHSTDDELPALLAQARADRELGVALERARSADLDGSLEQVRPGFGDAQLAARRAAFLAYGFPAWEMSEDAIRQRLDNSRIRRILAEELVALARHRVSPTTMVYPELFATMMRLDEDPYRRRLAEARLRKDTDTILKLAEERDLLTQTATTITQFAEYLKEEDQPVSVAALGNLRQARESHPADFELHVVLSGLLILKGDPDTRAEALAYSQVAVALRPQSALARSHLGYIRARITDLSGAETAYREALRLDPNNAVALASLGYIHITRRELSAAEHALREAIRLSPGYAYAHANLGVVLFKIDDRTGAEAEFRQALRINPNYAYAHINLGTVLLKNGDRTGAEGAIREAIRLDPTSARAQNILGSILLSRKDTDAAEEAIQKALQLDSRYAPAHVNRGNLLRERSDLGGAEKAYREAIRHDARDETAHINLGLVLEAREDKASAEAAYREAIRLNPNNILAQTKLGTLMLIRGDVAGAEAAYKIVLQFEPQNSQAQNNMGFILSRKGDLDGAEKAYREAIRLGPADAKKYSNLGAVLTKKKDVAGATTAYREALRLDPNYVIAHFNLGLLLGSNGKLDDAAAAYRDTIRLDPKYTRAHFELGRILLTKGDLAGAEAAFQRTLQLNPKYTLAQNALGRVLESKGDWAGAAAVYRDVLQKSPKSVPALHHLGFVLLRQKDPEGAIKALSEAIRLNPQHGRSYLVLAEARAAAGQPAAAFRVLTDALGQNAAWGEDPRAYFRYNAACFALRCGAGMGSDAPPEAERPAFRAKAFDFLSAELEQLQKLAASDPVFSYAQMKHWLADEDLVSIRERAALERLPIDERVGWVKLWTGVRELFATTAPREQAPPPRPAR